MKVGHRMLAMLQAVHDGAQPKDGVVTKEQVRQAGNTLRKLLAEGLLTMREAKGPTGPILFVYALTEKGSNALVTKPATDVHGRPVMERPSAGDVFTRGREKRVVTCVHDALVEFVHHGAVNGFPAGVSAVQWIEPKDGRPDGWAQPAMERWDTTGWERRVQQVRR